MDFRITESAAKRIGEIVSASGGGVFRLTVTGGGCQGFSYDMSVSQPEADDVVVRAHGASVAIDPVSAAYVASATIDWVSDLTGESFRITNPMATSSCGCGTSFSI